MRDRYWLALVFLSITFSANAQLSNYQCKWLKRLNAPVLLDSLTAAPSTIGLSSFDASFDYDPNTGLITIHSEKDDSVEVCYRHFPFNISQSMAHRSLIHHYDSNAVAKPIPVIDKYKLIAQRDELFRLDDIQKSGGISRGISFGNNQNVFVNSSLNLQMEGKITDNLSVRASITDQNVPFQPEGNTQVLQEFDNVFIQIFNDNFSLTGGDVVLRNRPGHFLRFYKNVQGGQLWTKYQINDKLKAETSATFSVAKGKFASIQVEPIEGVSGPYRLRGPNNERFIIVLANSEKVYIDGKLLNRGFNKDYTIDYNLAEVTFNTNVVITQFTRIRIDFEFSNLAYSRSIMNASHYMEGEKADFFFNYYQEKDNPNQSFAFTLTNDDKERLSEIGDDLSQAVIPTADSVAFNNNLVLYKQIDTLDLDNQRQTIFKFSANPDSARWNVSFAEVGPGKGSYVLLNTNANGRVFQWVSPVNGVLQGDFAPVAFVPTPNLKRMVTFGAGYKITPTDRVYSEVALSNHDLNLFSELDKEDDQGQAFKVGYEKAAVPIPFMKDYQFSGAIDYEYDQRYFNPIDRFRYIEFDRDWSFNPNEDTASFHDNIFNLNLNVQKDALNRLSYRLSRRKRGEQVDGVQHYLNGAKSIGRLQLQSDLFALNNEQGVQTSEWLRWYFTTYYRLGIFEPGYQYNIDRNRVFLTESDSITASAMNYREHKFFLRTVDTLKTRFMVDFSMREDRIPNQGELMDNNQSKTANFSLNTTIGKHHYITALMTYRNLKTLSAPPDAQDEETIMGRVDWQGTFFDRHVRSDLTYAIGNGRELRREFVYLLVNTGEGTHTWRDLNENGIQELSEFFEAINFDERNYIKVFVPTDEYVLAYTNFFNYRLNLEMPRSWKKQGGLKAFLSKFSNFSSFNIDKKITDDDLGKRLNPFDNNVANEDILAIRQVIRSTFFFNRSNPGYGFDVGIRQSKSRQLLTNGIEDRRDDLYSFNSRLNIRKSFNIFLKYTTGERSNDADFLEGRNFRIKSNSISPEVSWQPSNHFRLTGSYIAKFKRNLLSENQSERSDISEYIVEMRWTRATKNTLNARLRFVDIDFQGDENTPAGYELLEALNPGQNITWNFNYQHKLASGLQISLNYEGRNSEGANTVHVGRMQVTALF